VSDQTGVARSDWIHRKNFTIPKSVMAQTNADIRKTLNGSIPDVEIALSNGHDSDTGYLD
jgi:hypothetical protein